MPKKAILAAAVALALGIRSFEAEAQSISNTALPTGGQVVGGQASISQNGAAMRIEQASSRAAIDWQSFNIGAQASVTFAQPSASAIALNRVLGASGSEIFGRLSANGQVFLVNPNGILFGRGAQVDVGGLVASTLGMSPQDFMSGRYVLRGQGAPGSIVNQASIRAPRGSVALIAPSIVNDGLIETQHGAVSLTAANAATVDFMADGLVQIRIDEGALAAEIANNGVLRADGGSVTLTATARDSLASAVINNTGIIEARTVENVNGVVRLGGGDVYVSGTIDVSAADGVGGRVQVLGERVALVDSARVDASGAYGGGEVLIGGDFQGKNPAIPNAKYTYIGPDAVVRADARGAGDGGRVILWSDEVTRIYGTVSARGGALNGNGGFVETSGKRYLEVERAPDVSAPSGRGGTWLLDPETINIEAAGDNNTALISPFQPLAAGITSTLSVATLNAALNAGGTVIVDTSDITGLGTGGGDINVNAAVSKTSGSDATLELRAHNNININQSITSTNNRLDMVFNADQDNVGGGVINIGNATLNASGGTINAASEIVSISGSSPTIRSQFNVGTLNFSSGTLTAVADMNVATALNWSGGTMTGTGSTIVGGQFTVSGSIGLDAGRVLDVQGGADWRAGNINLNAGSAVGSGRIVNRAGSTFSTSFDGFMFTQNFGAGDDGTSALFDNLGTFQKTAGTGTSSIQNPFNNGGTLDVQSGTVNLTQGGTHAGSFRGAGTIQFGGGAHTLSAASSVTTANATFSAGTADLGGRYNITGATTVNGGVANFTGILTSLGSVLNISFGTANLGGAKATVTSFTQSGGTLSGTSTLTVSGPTTLSGGIMSGAGSTIVRGPLAISGSIGLDGGRVLDVQGSADWRAGNINLNAGSAAGSGTIVNRSGSTFSTSFDGFMFTQSFGANDDGSAALFDNLGTFQKTAGTGTTTTNRFNNSGTLDVQSGTVNLTQGGTHAGDFRGAGTIQFGGGTHALSPSSSGITTANATFSAGTTDVGGRYNVTGTTRVNGGVANFTGTLTSLGSALNVSFGTVNLGGANATVTSFAQSGGTLSGTSTLTVSGPTTLSGGIMSGPGSTITQGPLTVSGSIGLDGGRVLDVQGGADWRAGNINLNAGSAAGSGTIVNRAGSTFSTRFDGLMFTQSFGANDDGTSALFDNLGTFQKTAGTGTSSIRNPFNNTGALDVKSGTVNLTQGGTHSGSFSTLAGTTLQFSGGIHNLSNAPAVNSLGRLILSGATVNTSGVLTSAGLLELTSGTLNAGGAINTVTYKQGGGTLSGTSSLTVSGTTTLSGGTMSGAGSTIAQGPLVINGSIGLDAGRVLDVQGGASWTAGNINLNAGSTAGSGTIVNRAGSTFSTSFDGFMFTQSFGANDNGTSALFDNLGTFQKTAGTGTSSIQNPFNNGGALDVQAGTVNLTQGGTHSGSFSTLAGMTLQFSGGTHNLNNASAVNSLGRFLVSGATVNTAGALTSGGLLELTSGTLNAGAAITTASYKQSGGMLSGTSSLTVSGTTTLSGGTMSGAGSTVAQGPLVINGSIGLDAGRVLDVQGGAIWTAGNINLNAGSAVGSGTIVNRAGSTFSTSFDGFMFTQSFGTADDGTSALFNNLGTFQKTAGAFTSSIQNSFNNSGAIAVQSGTLSLSGFPTNFGSIAISNNATLSSNGNSLTNSPSGLIQGTGTLDLGTATLTNDGTIRAGASAGALNINGALVLGPTSVIDVEVQNQWTTAGVDFDVINATGGAMLDGTLNIVHFDGAAPPAGQQMQVVNAVAVTKSFASVNPPSGSTYTVLYNPANVTLQHDSTLLPPPIVSGPLPITAATTVSATTGFEPSTVASAGMTSASATISTETSASSSPVALSVRPHFALPDISHLIAAMSELRKKKLYAVENAVRILERDPAAADLPSCAGEVSGNCIAERPARLGLLDASDRAAPELAHLWGIERKIALLIGVEEYQDPIPRLGSPLKDIAEIGRLYREQFGYEVRALANADKASIVREINRLILETRANDSVVVFYAGHGHVVEKTGRGYWIPGRAGGEEPTQWISNSDIAKMLANIPARQVLLVSDSCYSGTLTREGKVEKSEVLPDPRAVLERRSVTVLSSGGEEPVADAGKDGHSVFAWHFLRTLGRVAQWSNGVDIYERLAEAVQLDFPQQPQYGAALGAGHEPGADFLFEVRRY